MARTDHRVRRARSLEEPVRSPAVAPVAGEIQDVGQVVTGRDANGNQLSTGDRVITGVAAAVPIVSGPMLRWGAKKVIKGLAKAGPAITAGAARAGRAMTAGAGAVKGFVRRITGGAAEQAGKQAAEEAGSAGRQRGSRAGWQAGRGRGNSAGRQRDFPAGGEGDCGGDRGAGSQGDNALRKRESSQ